MTTITKKIALFSVLVVMGLGANALAATGSITYDTSNGMLIATSDMGLTGIATAGPDLTAMPECDLCAGDSVPGFGADAALSYTSINFYDLGTSSSQWALFHPTGMEGADFTGGVKLATSLGLTATDFPSTLDGGTGNFTLQFADNSTLTGTISIIPEPATASMAIFAMLGIFGLARKRR